MYQRLSLLGKLALMATVHFSFIVPSSGQQITSTNIHRRILETNKGMSLEEIKGVFSQRYAEICGDDRKITLDEFMQVPEFHKFRGKLLTHPSIEKFSKDEKVKVERFFRNTQARTFSLFDRNNDQSISETEFVEMSLKTAKRVDQNGDGFLSIQEVQEDMERRR